MVCRGVVMYIGIQFTSKTKKNSLGHNFSVEIQTIYPIITCEEIIHISNCSELDNGKVLKLWFNVKKMVQFCFTSSVYIFFNLFGVFIMCLLDTGLKFEGYNVKKNYNSSCFRPWIFNVRAHWDRNRYSRNTIGRTNIWSKSTKPKGYMAGRFCIKITKKKTKDK